MLIIVTGASAGFGKEIASRLLARNHRVIITGRRADRLEQIRKHYPKTCYSLAFDISNQKETVDAMHSLPDNWRDIDILINNAGLALGVCAAQNASLADWDKMIDTNIKGLVTITHVLLPKMVARNTGLIINMGSIAGDYPYPGGNVYGASKAFVRQFSLNLRADLVGTGVRVTNLEPGLCGGTEFSHVRLHGDNKKAEAVYEGVQPLTSQDIADTVVWILERPAHVNINRIELMPVAQASAGLQVVRNTELKESEE